METGRIFGVYETSLVATPFPHRSIEALGFSVLEKIAGIPACSLASQKTLEAQLGSLEGQCPPGSLFKLHVCLTALGPFPQLSAT